GEHRWSVGQDRTGYSSPTLLRVAQETQLVVYSGTALLGIDPTEGVLLWRYAYETDYDCNIAMPINVGDDIFISSGENHGSLLLSVSKQGTSYEVEERWASQGRKSVMRNEWQTSIHLDGVLYGFDNVGSAGPITHLTCVDAETGGRKWQESRFGKGNLICADGKLLITTMDGEFVMAKASPDGFAEMGRQKLIGMTRQAPSLANGKVYLRDDTEIVCLDLRQ
ncbi:MAG: PQQ-binding-like beta-propeller repeat protein, partial [Planctomycetota bacterium]|nr:PQQ-binding-like beta-propeller repeat protein [Planctomycetota bacterium]